MGYRVCRRARGGVRIFIPPKIPDQDVLVLIYDIVNWQRGTGAVLKDAVKGVSRQIVYLPKLDFSPSKVPLSRRVKISSGIGYRHPSTSCSDLTQ